ncbi:alpha/beta hydrolase [Desulfovermiculus halophilus]|uniref:alpha/beta hydrolase n=1 Tax=Desulfovermiculus halophilus TaxID=339722 RepID=UPI000485F289|nr:alpha/beta fold hydrolase [Desulfovermiculus halophilus]
MNMSPAPSCLLLHGYGGAPYDVSPLARALENQGLPVRTPCLPGHKETPEAFARSRFTHWLQAAEEQVQEMRARGPCVVIGLSMGGSLALNLAERYSLAGVVTIAAPVFLYTLFPWKGASRLLPLVSLLRHLRPIVLVPETSKQAMAIAPHAGYEGIQALHPLHSLIKGLRPVYRNLHRITAPLLVLHSPQDRTVPVDNAWHILRGVSSKARRMELLPITEEHTSRHLLTTHVETKDKVQQAVLHFLDRNDIAGAD